ncbi:MipA/OmpV family protein [Croceibacterium sp. TMG7-5b_MA50]|uniref:MipA/OmpV family protein n=1 Tax=Croceibacterium sp. TMG7-5b_MA50 TaxID=3121290 RepID=UPI003221DF4F
MRHILPPLFATCCAIPAAAQEAPSAGGLHGQVAVGAGVAPEYDGSDDMRVIPLLFGDLQLGDVTLELRGLRARADLIADPRLSLGPVIAPRLERNDVDGPVGLLPEIDTAVEAGAFVGYRLGGDARGQGAVQVELTALHDVSDVHNGSLVTGSASYAAIRRLDLFVSLDAQATWADADYTRIYFGIAPAAAMASNLAPYDPGAGFRDVGAGITVGYYFSRRWGVIGRAGANYLIGDPADSPVTDEGRRWQPLAGVALSYRF